MLTNSPVSAASQQLWLSEDAFPPAFDLVRLLAIDVDASIIDSVSRTQEADSELVWGLVEAEAAQLAHVHCEGSYQYRDAAARVLAVVEALAASMPAKESRVGSITIDVVGLVSKCLGNEHLFKQPDIQSTPEDGEAAPLAVRNLAALLASFAERSSSNWLLPMAYIHEGSRSLPWSPVAILGAMLYESARFVSEAQHTRPTQDNDTFSLTGVLLLVLRRFSDKCLPWVDTNYIKLAHAAGGADMLRLLLQYHDPELSLHLDQHPLPREASRRHRQAVDLVVTHATLPQDDLAPEAFIPRTFGEAACAYACGMSPTPHPPDVATAARLSLEGLWCRVLFSHTVACRGGASATVPTGSSRNGHVPFVSSGEALFPAFLFIASVIHRREELLSLGDGGRIGEFWGMCHPLGAGHTVATGDGQAPVGRSPVPPPLLFEPTRTDDGVNGHEIVREVPSFHIELLSILQEDPTPWRRAFRVVACESVPRVLRNTPKSTLNLLRREVLATDRCDYSAVSLSHLREYILGFAALPVTANELAASFPNRDNAAGASAFPRDPDQLRYIVLDTRSETSFLYARLPTAIHMGSDVGFDRAMMRTSLLKVNPIRYSHLSILGTGRQILEEANLLKCLAFALVEGDTAPPAPINDNDDRESDAPPAPSVFVGGLPYVSVVDGGFRACVPYIKSGTMECVRSSLPPPEESPPETEAKALFTEGKKVAAETLGSLSSGVAGWFSRLSVSHAPEPAGSPVPAPAAGGLSSARSWGAGVWKTVAEKVTTATPPVESKGPCSHSPPVVLKPSSSQPQWGDPSPPPTAGATSSWVGIFRGKQEPTQQAVEAAPASSDPTPPTSSKRLFELGNHVPATATTEGDEDDDLDLILSVGPAASAAQPATETVVHTPHQPATEPEHSQPAAPPPPPEQPQPPVGDSATEASPPKAHHPFDDIFGDDF